MAETGGGESGWYVSGAGGAAGLRKSMRRGSTSEGDAGLCSKDIRVILFDVLDEGFQ